MTLMLASCDKWRQQVMIKQHKSQQVMGKRRYSADKIIYFMSLR